MTILKNDLINFYSKNIYFQSFNGAADAANCDGIGPSKYYLLEAAVAANYDGVYPSK